jgi:hypothetical protein
MGFAFQTTDLPFKWGTAFFFRAVPGIEANTEQLSLGRVTRS